MLSALLLCLPDDGQRAELVGGQVAAAEILV
jgi:hypothetical protein